MSEAPRSANFLTEIIEADLAAGRNGGRVVTRFPPEPNGFLHVGHAKSILLNHGLAKRYAGRFHMRFDDTNPTTEEAQYVDAIVEDLRWLGADWDGRLTMDDVDPVRPDEQNVDIASFGASAARHSTTRACSTVSVQARARRR